MQLCKYGSEKSANTNIGLRIGSPQAMKLNVLATEEHNRVRRTTRNLSL